MKKGKSGCYFLTLGKTRGTYFSKMYSKYYFIASFFFYLFILGEGISSNFAKITLGLQQ